VSWDATLYEVIEVQHCKECSRELEKPRQDRSEIGWWNYTHNTSQMIYDACKWAGIDLGEDERWYQHLDGMNGIAGRRYLDTIIRQLEAEPERYQRMNPPNGWGSYDSLLVVLKEMREASDGKNVVWHASG
jgi:hypothetical protein